MASWQELHRQAIILDIETSSLGRGASVLELATYEAQRQRATQWRVQASATSLTVVHPTKPQDVLGFATRASDTHRLHPGLVELARRGKVTHKDILVAQVLMNKSSKSKYATANEIRKVTEAQLMSQLKTHERFLHDAIQGKIGEGKFSWLKEETSRIRDRASYEAGLQGELKKAGARIREVQAFDDVIENILSPNSEFLRRTKGHAIWIANANFESKQIGAKLAVIEQGVREAFESGKITEAEYKKRITQAGGLREQIRGTSYKTSDVLAVTGIEMNRARAMAQITGDWGNVYKTILETTKAGDVRDILDLVKSQQSMLKKMGMLEQVRPHGFGIDVSARLYGFSRARGDDAAKALLQAEAHKAIFDVAVSEDFVLRESLRQNNALDEVLRGTNAGKRFLEEAKLGRGALADAIRYAQAHSAITPALQEAEAKKRFGRLLADFAESNKTVQTQGRRMGEVKRLLPDGSLERTPQAFSTTRTFNVIEDAVSHVARDPHYSAIDARKVWSSVQERMIREGALAEVAGTLEIKNREQLGRSLADLESHSNAYVDDWLSKMKMSAGSAAEFEQSILKNQMTVDSLQSRFGSWKAMDLPGGKMMRYAGMFALGMGAAGAIKNIYDGPSQGGGHQTYRTMNYDNWLAHHSEYAGLDESTGVPVGLPRSGMGARMNSRMTDFGSPYSGPIYSQYIFEQQKLLAEREKYLREMYNVQHYDPNTTLGGYFKHFQNAEGDPQSIFKSIRSATRSVSPTYTEHSFITSGEMVSSKGYHGMANMNLFRVDLSNYKVSAEDADTIVLRKKGVTGAVSSFFGMGEEFKFRMAGIDAPETAHGPGTGYKSAMPYADAGTVALQGMLAGGTNLELLVDPKNMTYGRQVATIFQDGRNLNLELVKRGYAAHLPFRKKGVKEMYNPQVFSRAEALAQGADRNMWSSPFFKAYEDIVAASGQTITFNTFTQPNKLARNSTLMSASALMRNAQEQGMYGNAQAVAAAEIGERFKHFGFKPDYKDPILHNWGNAPHKNYMTQMLQDTEGLIKSKGGKISNKLSRKSGYGNLDKSLSLDTMNSSNSIWNKRKLWAYEAYDVENDRRRQRREMMASAQRRINNQLFQSPINHHRM